jgi:hypothetical protein
MGVGSGLTYAAHQESDSEAALDFEDDWSTIDWAAIARQGGETLAAEADTDRDDEVLARLYLLNGGYAVFLEASEGATCLAIDLSEDESSRVRRIAIDDLEPGMFVLLRTEGGGDYVIPVADRILGARAPSFREAQRTWKSRLRSMARNTTLHDLVLRLRANGSLRADDGNVRHWMSERAIATQDRIDFVAIMRVVGLESQADHYWAITRTIRAAHLHAGKVIRDLLLRRVKATDVEHLRKEGRLDFVLPEAQGGRLTAFGIEGRAPTTTRVPGSRLGRVFVRRD